MKNKTLIVFILFLIVIIGYESYIFYEGNYCDSKTNNYSDQYQNDSIVEEQKENVSKNETKVENFDEEKIKEENLQANEFLGTFEFTDKSNNVWVLIVKADETATIKNKDGKSTAYASWYKYNTMRYVHFSCSDRAPMITFPGSELYIPSNPQAISMAISIAVKSLNTMHHDSMSVNFVRFLHTFPFPHNAT